jgi:hypothetical protein
LGLGTRPTVRYFFLKTKKYHTVGLVPNPIRNKVKTKKYHTVGLVPNPNRNKLRTKEHYTVGVVPNPIRNNPKEFISNGIRNFRPRVWYFFVFSLFLLGLGTRPLEERYRIYTEASKCYNKTISCRPGDIRIILKSGICK